MRVLALIAARARSKGLRNKNMRLLAGKPLLVRAVELAQHSRRRGERWRIAVSSDSLRYLRAAGRAGADVLLRRPATLARDTSRLVDVVRHVEQTLDARRHFDVVLLLSATAPLTRPNDVRALLRLFERHRRRRSVVSVMPAPVHPSWCLTTRGGVIAGAVGRVRRRQEGGPWWALNGALLAAPPGWLEDHGQFVVPGRTVVYPMPKRRSLDVEDAHDLRLAALLLGS